MRNIFIVNPAAGNGAGKKILDKIGKAADDLNLPAEIYITTAVSDGEMFTKKVLEERKGESNIRFYACGGDGTLNEVINGAVGYQNVEIGQIPVGTGNDFIRNFEDRDFLDIKGQILGISVPVDLINYKGVCDGEKVSRYCANMFNIGFDCNVADLTGKLKEKPFIKGSSAYLISVLLNLISKKGAAVKITFEDGKVFNEKLLLVAIGNGSFCGGGIKGLPKAKLDDGLMDITLVKNISRRTFIKLFPKYAKGTHLEEENIHQLIDYKKNTKLTVEPNGQTMKLCIDGEMSYAQKIDFEVVNNGFNFILPNKGEKRG